MKETFFANSAILAQINVIKMSISCVAQIETFGPFFTISQKIYIKLLQFSLKILWTINFIAKKTFYVNICQILTHFDV